LHWPCLLNAAELAAVIGWPTNSPQLPGLTLGGCRQLAPAADIPSYGRVIAHATFPGARRPLAIAPDDRLRHAHVIGPTGTGKSTLLLNLIVQDMAAGDGVVVIDPKGDLISDCLQRVPRHRLHDVMLLDPTDAERPVGLNLLSAVGDGAELMVEQVVGIFHNLYSAFWGPRTDDILRAALLTLTHQPGMTLAEVPLLLTDEGFRRRLVARLDEPVALEPFWAWYESLKASERSVVIGPVLNKLRSFLLRGRVRSIIGQSESTIDFTELLAGQRILFVSLAKGLLGEEAAALLGSLVVARLWQATQARAGLLPSQRPRVLVHIDEFQDYLNLPTSMADLLAQARGLGVGLVLAHQHLGQLPIEVRRAVLANARSRVVFQTGAEDARLLAREFEPHLTPADLQGLGPHEVVAAFAVGAHVAPPATGVTSPPPPATSRAASVRTASRQRYGRDRTAVEQAIRARHSQPAPAGAIGRARRAS
jgi:type IV secretory pathway TraG/TraD family ATPase VirD4